MLASRADPAAARRLGVSHVRGILLSGPPGCGKTLLARELSRSLGAREPQIVNGPEIIDKFVGEAEKKVRELFAPAEAEWAAAGDASGTLRALAPCAPSRPSSLARLPVAELHVIILDEMDAIARKRGALSGDTTGVRDSVVNQVRVRAFPPVRLCASPPVRLPAHPCAARSSTSSSPRWTASSRRETSSSSG